MALRPADQRVHEPLAERFNKVDTPLADGRVVHFGNDQPAPVGGAAQKQQFQGRTSGITFDNVFDPKPDAGFDTPAAGRCEAAKRPVRWSSSVP